MDASSGTTKLKSAKLESPKLELIMSFGEDGIIRKSPDEIAKIRRSGNTGRKALNHLHGVVAGGVSLLVLQHGPWIVLAWFGSGSVRQRASAVAGKLWATV